MTATPIWHALPLPAFALGRDDRVEEANSRAEGFLNRSARNVTGSPIDAVLTLDTGLGAATERVRRTQAPLTLHDGSVRTGPAPPVRCDVFLSPLGDGTLLLIAPQEIAERLDRVRSTGAAARQAVGMAEMMAHEIKNPLAGITGAAQLLSMNVAGDDLELTELIVAESRRIVKLLDQVEQFGNLRPPERRALNVHDVLDRARRSAMVGVAAHMAIEERYDPSLPPVLGDPDQLLQVFQNLLKNAAQVAEHGGKILLRTFYEASLRVRRGDGSDAPVPVHVEVIDDGPGVPADLSRDLFEPFVSGRENGTGLGLALAVKILRDHDGLITFDSEPGRTAFRVSLPLAPKEKAIDMNVTPQHTGR